MKLLLSARIHTPKPRITAPKIWKKIGVCEGGLESRPVKRGYLLTLWWQISQQSWMWEDPYI